MRHPASFVAFFVLSAVLGLALAFHAKAQPLTDPYTFTMGPELKLDTGLVVGPWDGPQLDRIVMKDGHFAHSDGRPFRMVGTTLQYSGCFPDSATAIAMADRLRALGINVVRFTGFDYTMYWPISILNDATTTTGGGLHPVQMLKLDWFLYQLRQRGIRYGFSFQSAWLPRPGDNVRQPDSTGFGARTTIIFDPVIQRIHRDVIRLLLTHVNPYTTLAYKDDPGLVFVMPLDDSPLSAYWLYTKDIVLNNPNGNRSIGQQHVRWIDSVFYAYLKGKGLTTDAALKKAWSTTPSDPKQQVRNGGFEDPFDPSWTLGVNTNDGAQAILQYTESDKVSGTQCGRVRIGKLSANKAEGTMYLYQTLGKVERLHRYRLSLQMRTTATKVQRPARLLLYNTGYPYNSYGLNVGVTLTAAWKPFTFDFTASSIDAGTGALQIQFGSDSGDVYIDDVTFTEIATDGLHPGESLVNGTLRRDVFFDQNTTPERFKANANFYQAALENLLVADRKLIRDTLGCKTLLVPSSRSFLRLDQQAGMSYDFFSSTDWRSTRTSMLGELYGGTLMAHSQNDYDTKALVLSFVGISYPLPYQHEEAIIMPAYAGLQNWDGVFFSLFAEVPAAGNVKVDSNSTWNIFDKPNVLTQLPAASNMLRRYDVDTSSKLIQIANNQETLDFPQFHLQVPYSLSVYVDGRMPAYRKAEILEAIQTEESITPHREVSALSGNMVDPATIDAENEQIFWDATRGVIRTLTPNYLCVAGSLGGQIVAESDIIVEQTSGNANSAITITTLTDEPVLESGRNLLVVGGRGLNAGATFGADGAMVNWGPGPFQMEGRNIRVTLKAPSFDSCRVVPLGSDAKPKNRGTTVGRSQTGRFSLALNTSADATPWYVLEFFNTPTSVAGGSEMRVTVAPNPTADVAYVRASGEFTVRLVDLQGREHATANGLDELRLPVGAVATGTYVLEVKAGTQAKTEILHIIH